MPILPIAAQQAVRDDQSARQPVQPAIKRLVEVLAGGRRADGGAHHDEHRDGDERELVEPGVERLGHHAHRVEALEDQQEDDRDGAEPERDRHAGNQDEQRHDEHDEALRGGAHSVGLSPVRPNGGERRVTRQIVSTRYCSTSSPRPSGMAL
jgi:hypothetical protein